MGNERRFGGVGVRRDPRGLDSAAEMVGDPLLRATQEEDCRITQDGDERTTHPTTEINMDLEEGSVLIDPDFTITGVCETGADVELDVNGVLAGRSAVVDNVWSISLTPETQLQPGNNVLTASALAPGGGTDVDIKNVRLFDYAPPDLPGVFTRSGIASYFDRPARTVTIFAIDTPRFIGPSRDILIEASRGNSVKASEDMTAVPPWDHLSAATVAGDVAVDPAGTSLADRMSLPVPSQVRQIIGVGLGVITAKSCFYQSEDGPADLGVGGPLPTGVVCITIAADVWDRYEWQRGVPGQSLFTQIFVDPPCPGATGTVVVLTWGAQWELGVSKSSWVRNISLIAAAIRAPDISEHPTWFNINTAPWSLPYKTRTSSADAANVFNFPLTELNLWTLFSVGTGAAALTSDELFLKGTAIGAELQVNLQGVGVLTTPLTYPEGADLLFAFDNLAGTITIAGATTGNGVFNLTPWTWRTGVFAPGRRLFAAVNNGFGIFSRPEPA